MKNLILLNRSGMSPDGMSRKGRHAIESIVSRLCLASLICLCMLTIGVGNAWGATATFTASDQGWSGTSTKTQTVSGVTFSFAGGTTNPTYYAADGLRTYENCVITISSTNTITGIVFTYTISNSGYLKSFNTGTWTSGTKTWSGSATSINCTVGHSSGSKNGQVRITSIVVTYTPAAADPTLTTSASSLTEVGYSTADFSQQVKSFTVSGSSLTANVTVTAPTNYEVCKTSGGTYTSSVSFDKGSGTLAASTVYVRLQSGKTAGSYSGNVACSSSGATTKNVAVSGSVPFTVTWKANGTTHATTYVTYATGTGTALGSLPTDPDPSDYTCSPKAFYGWYDGVSYSDASIAPSIISTSTKITSDKTYNAVFATASGGAATWDKVTTLAGITAGTYVIINNSKYLPNTATSSAPAQGTAPTITGTRITGTVTDEMKWYFTSTGTANQFYIQNEDDDYLYETSANNGLRVGGTSDKWTFAANTLPAFSLQGQNNSRYCATYESGSDWRSYTSANAGNYGDEGKVYLYKLTGGTTYSNYATTCCTPLGSITGSFTSSNLSQSSGVLTATLPSASKNANATSYRFTLYNNSDVEITHTDVATGGGDVSTTFSSPNVTAGNTYKVSVTPLVSPQGSFCSTTGTESDKASITMHYTVTLAVNNAEYGSISPTSTLYVASGTSISASTNILSVGATNITATYTPQTAQYTYGFTNWTWSPSGSTITANTTATANFSRSTRTYNVTTTGITHATASPAIPATVAYGGSITTTITADANYTLPSVITVTGATLDNWNSSTGALSITDVTGDVSITITAVTAMKRIYMNTGGTSDGKWGKDSPKFFVHSWGSSDDDAELVAQPCASNVFYVDIPAANTNLLFTRQDPSKGSSIIYKGNDGNWGQSVDITISTNNYFTFNGNWDVSDGKSGFNAGTYTPDMKTIYLSFCAEWLENNPLFALYDVTHSTWMSTFAEAGTGCYAGYYIAQVPSCATTVLIGRFKPGTPAPFGWSGENWWGQSVDFTIGSDTYDKITIEGWGTEGEAKDKGYGSLGNFALTQYSISFAGGGGTGSMSSLTNKDCGSDVTLPNVSFTKTGYDFDGWHADVDVKVGGATIPVGSTIANQATLQDIRSNVALTAQWVAKEYTITLDREGASTGSVSVTMTYNSSSHTAITAPTKTGYNFGGWYSGDNGTGSQVMNASGVLQANVDGYTGAGGVWTRTTTPTTLYAKWIAKEYTITLDREGASTGATSVTATYDAGTLAGWSAPSKTGYTFGGYWSGDNGVGTLVISTTGVLQSGVTISADNWTDGSGHWIKDGGVTVYAKWTAEQYTITYKDQGGGAYSGSNSASLPGTHTYGAATALVDGVKAGYRFDGWFDNSTCTGAAVTSIGATAITANTTYYAKWTQVYTVTWHVNGSTYNTGVVDGNSRVPSGGKISVCPTAPLDNTLACANKFMGWSENNAGATAKTASYYDDLFTDVAGSPYINANKDFYAVFAESSGGENILISNVSELTAGTQVYIYAETSDVSPFTAVMKAYESGNNVRAVSGSVSTNKLTPSEGACAYTIGEVTVSATKYYTFNDGTYYLRATGTDKNYLVGAAALGDDEKGLFSISIDAGVFSITCKNTSVRGVMQFNKNGDTGVYDKALFACYSSASQTNVQLFKKNPLVFSNYVTECDANIVAVTYNANSGSTSCMNTTTDKTEDYTVCSTPPTRDYYTFAGWLCSADDEVYDAGATILAAAIDADFSLTAQWTPVTYTITYELDGGTNHVSNPASYNVETATITLQNPTKGHDRFDGWYNNGSFTGDAITSIPLGSHGNVTLYAKWAARHHIEFFKEGVRVGEIWRADDENMEDAVAGQGSVPSDPSAPTTCSSKVFVGWTEEPIDDETDDEPADLMKPAAGTVDEDKEFHAVWDTESSSSGTETIFTDDFNVTGTDEVTSRSGWTDLSTVYGGSGSIRFSSGKNAGSMTLDVSGMEMSGTWEIKFKIKKYGSDGSGALAVSSAFGDVTTSFSPTSVSTTDGANWTEKTITVTGVHSGTEIHFDGTANSRVYVKDVEIKRTGTITTHSAYSTSCCATKVTLSKNSPEHGTIAFGKTKTGTCGGDKEVSLTITPEAGYQLHSYEVATGGGKVATKSVSPDISLDNNSSAVQNITLTFASGANGAYDVTASFTEMTVTSWAWTMHDGGGAVPDPLNLYVGQSARLDVAYTPSTVVSGKKTYTRNKDNAYINWVGSAYAGYSTISGKASTGENTTAVTFTHADGPTKTVNVKVLPLPLTHFEDLVHGKAFADVAATIVENALSATKNTPISDDWTTPNANPCEENHLHLVGWIREDWPALVAYLNGTGDAPSTAAIVGAGNDGAGHAYFIAAGASINVQIFDGVTFYAVWSKVE